MLNLPCRCVRTLPAIPSIRVFSTSPRLQDYSRPARVRTTKFVEALHRKTGEPIWQLVKLLHAPGHRLGLSEALHSLELSAYQYNRWKPIIYDPDISSALTALRRDGFIASHSCPPWVLLYLTVYKVRTPHHATGPLMDLAYACMDDAPAEVKAALLTFTAFHLARFNLLVPIRQVVNSFLNIPFSDPHRHNLYFNLFLQALSCNPTRSVENCECCGSHLEDYGVTSVASSVAYIHITPR